MFSHKNFESPCTDSNLAMYWKKLHNHYNWRVSTFKPLHGISKFLLLNNFFLATKKSHVMTLFKKCLRLSQTYDLCLSRQKNLIFSKGQRKKIEFLIFLPSSFILEAMKKKLATSSFPNYFYANLPDVFSYNAVY